MNKFNGINVDSYNTSPWVSALLNDKNKDPYDLFKDSIALMLETYALKIQNELMNAHPTYTKETAFKMAICLMMERMLVIQNEHAPKSLESMVTSLFIELPSLKDLRSEIIAQARVEVQTTKKKSFLSRLLGW